MLSSALNKKRAVGLVLFLVVLALFFSFNRFPKLDAVGGDLDAVTAPQVQCFQGFCIEREPGVSFLKSWWIFSVTYLRLVTVGMTFAFVVAGLAEAFLFPTARGVWFKSGSVFGRTVRGLAVGPVMNLCSACIVPVSSAFQRRGGGIEGAIAMVQGSATLNIPALAMVFFVFTPLLGFSRLVLALVGGLVIGPIVLIAVRRGRGVPADEPELVELDVEEGESGWGPAMAEGFRDWAKTSVGYLARMGPIMVVAGFASGLAIQWVSPDTVSEYLGNDVLGVAIAATFGVLINVPLLFEIPLVALLLLLGMGTAPAATLLFTAAAGGPVTFWGLARVMPKRGIAAFATATWGLGAVGGLAVLGIGALIWDTGSPLRVSGPTEPSTEEVEDALDRPPNALLDGLIEGPPLFVDVTLTAGVHYRHREWRSPDTPPGAPDIAHVMPFGAGVAVIDFDGDGFQDIYVTGSERSNALYRNNGDGTFTDVAVVAGVDDRPGRGKGACAADYDNDGQQDLYLTNFGPSRLFHNNGDGTFADLTSAAGLDESAEPRWSTGCAWGDYDRDGHLDLVVARHLQDWFPTLYETKGIMDAVGSLGLYRNRGDGTFEDVTDMLSRTASPRRIETNGRMLTNVMGAGFQPAWVDLDNDGDVDLYVVNDYGGQVQPNVLWRNDGPTPDGTWAFADASVGSGADVPMDGMGLAIGDYNLDGLLDLYVTNIGDAVLLRNEGKGLKFTDSASEAGAAIGRFGGKDRVTWGAMFLDFDNDGDEDLYVVSGFLSYVRALSDDALTFEPAYHKAQPNVVLRNEGDGKFVDVSRISGADDPGIGRGGVYLDFDKDGCLDLFVANSGQSAKLFRNTCDPGNSWLVVRPEGTVSNRDAIGARVTVVAGGRAQIREISSGASFMGQNMLAAHFGLGEAKVADFVLIRWPNGVVQTLTDVPANQRITVTEP